LRRRAANELDLVGKRRFARYRNCPRADGIEGDIPETGTWHRDFRREMVESAAMIGVSAAILETAKVGVVHQTDIAALGTFDDDNIVFIQVFALVYEFHVTAPQGDISAVRNDNRCQPNVGLHHSLDEKTVNAGSKTA
jgi:hypothetical protein